MENYEVIETHAVQQAGGGSAKLFAVRAVNFKVPTYIMALVSEGLKDRDVVQAGDKRVYLNGRDIGEIREFKSGSDVKIDATYNIKYTGGYSRTGSTIYIDANFPKMLEVGGKKVDSHESIGRHHELTEKWFVDDAYDYPYAHEIADRIERAYVESLGVSWDDYSREVNRHLTEVSSAKLARSPKDLDITPYVSSRDWATLKEIRESMEY